VTPRVPPSFWWLALGLVLSLPLQGSNSERLAQLLIQSYDLPQNHEEFLREARQLEIVFEGSPLKVPARAMIVLGLLHGGDQEGAKAILQEFYSARGEDAATEAGREFARHWLTVFDREEVAAALRAYYRRHIRYPESLDALQVQMPEVSFPRTDRWGAPWDYQIVQPRFFANTNNQTFTLESPRIPGVRSMVDALAQKVGEDLQWVQAQRVITRQRGVPAAVAFARRGTSAVITLSEGSGSGGYWFLGWVDDRLFISDGTAFRGVRPPQ